MKDDHILHTPSEIEEDRAKMPIRLGDTVELVGRICGMNGENALVEMECGSIAEVRMWKLRRVQA